MLETNVTVTNRIGSGSTWAIRSDNGETVYVPPAVAKAINASPGKSYTMALQANTGEKRDRTPWVAVSGAGADVPDGFVMPTESALRGVLNDGPATADRIARELVDCSDGSVLRAVRSAVVAMLYTMFNKGDAVKSEVYIRNKTGSVATIWAITVDDLLDGLD